MSEKVTIQDIIELLAEKHSMTKKDAEIFVKGMFELIEEALVTEKYEVRPENSPTTRTRHSASESTRFFIVSSSFVVMRVYNRNTCLS